MKHNQIVRRMISALLVLFAFLTLTTTSHAAFQAYLRFNGVSGPAKGVTKIVHWTAGSADVGRLPAGTYNVQVAWVDGGKTSMDDWGQIMKMAVKGQGVPATYTITMTTKPNNSLTTNSAQADPNSGASVGRRRHDPITIRKEIDAASPKFFSVSIAAGDVDADGMVDLMMAVKTQGAGPVPTKN